MIKKPNNWNNVHEMADRPKLPIGAYVCKIRKAVVQANDYGDQLCVLFDIDSGSYNGFYAAEFKSNTSEDKKWKGVLRLWLAKDDGSEKDEFTKSIFKGFVTAVESSNHGYQFDWNEASLVGKEIGILFRNEEWDFKGKTGWAVRPFRALSVESVEDGSFTIPKDKPLKGKESVASAQVSNNDDFSVIDDDTEDLPF